MGEAKAKMVTRIESGNSSSIFSLETLNIMAGLGNDTASDTESVAEDEVLSLVSALQLAFLTRGSVRRHPSPSLSCGSIFEISEPELFSFRRVYSASF